MLNRIYLIIIAITIICGPTYADALPFRLVWGQTKDEVRLNVEIDKPLKEKDNVLYYKLEKSKCEPSVHFIFDKSDRLYQIMMLAACDDKDFADFTFTSLQEMLARELGCYMVHTEYNLTYVYYNMISDSYVLLNGYIEDGKYKVLLDYEQAKTSLLKKYDKRNDRKKSK